MIYKNLKLLKIHYGSTDTWSVDTKTKIYKQFGHNSNKHWYLACSAVELVFYHCFSLATLKNLNSHVSDRKAVAELLEPIQSTATHLTHDRQYFAEIASLNYILCDSASDK